MSNAPIVLSSIPDVDDANPFFFRNTLISTNIYIAQRCKSEENALYILDVWNRENYNVGDTDTEETSDIAYTRVIYNSNSNIKIEEIFGGNDDYTILIYKKNNKLNYIALLQYKVM